MKIKKKKNKEKRLPVKNFLVEGRSFKSSQLNVCKQKPISLTMMIYWLQAHKQHHKNCYGWYLTLQVPIYSIVGIQILYIKMYQASNKLSDIVYGCLVTAFTNFRALLLVNNSVQWSHRLEDTCTCCFFLALRLTTMSLDTICSRSMISLSQRKSVITTSYNQLL